MKVIVLLNILFQLNKTIFLRRSLWGQGCKTTKYVYYMIISKNLFVFLDPQTFKPRTSKKRFFNIMKSVLHECNKVWGKPEFEMDE